MQSLNLNLSEHCGVMEEVVFVCIRDLKLLCAMYVLPKTQRHKSKSIQNLWIMLHQLPTLSIYRNLSSSASNCPGVFLASISRSTSCNHHQSQKFWTIIFHLLPLGYHTGIVEQLNISKYFSTFYMLKKIPQQLLQRRKILVFQMSLLKLFCRQTCHLNASVSGVNKALVQGKHYYAMLMKYKIRNIQYLVGIIRGMDN